jgi:multiple sugar transport system ATP-binding protein
MYKAKQLCILSTKRRFWTVANVTLSGVGKAFGDTPVLHNVDLDIRDGEFMVFVGPSGCGKSTLLRVIAGLEDITQGTLKIGDRLVNDVPPAERGIAMVFQSYALYPHMNLYDNMAFGLQLAKVPKADIDASVRSAARVLNIEHLLDRKPKALSGGQRQRVAIGRAIVRKPEVFLFDEPLSNLDAALRVRMRYEFAKLHEELKTTMVYVTHDQVEAMTLADRIVVLSAGKVEQVGTPMALYQHPRNLFVAGFLGSPRMNFVPAVVQSANSREVVVQLQDGSSVRCAVDASSARVGDAVTLGVRPEHLRVPTDGGVQDGQPGPDAGNVIKTTITFVESLGSNTQAYGEVAGAPDQIACTLDGAARVRAGQTLHLHVDAAACHLFDAQGKAYQRHAAQEHRDVAGTGLASAATGAPSEAVAFTR